MSKSSRLRKVAWNRGKIVGQKPPLKIKEVWAIRVRLQLAERSRDLALFNLAIDSKLRGCDVVKVGVEDVLLSSRASVVQQKTGKPVTFEITEQTRSAIQGWLHQLGRQRGPLFPSRVNPKRNISTRQYARLVDSWISSIGLDPSAYGTHSLRRTKATLIYRRTGNIVRSSCCSGTPSWKAPSDTLASKSRTPWRSRSKSTSKSALSTKMG